MSKPDEIPDEIIGDMAQQIQHLMPIYKKVDKLLSKIIELIEEGSEQTSEIFMRNTRPYSFASFVVLAIHRCFGCLGEEERIIFAKLIYEPFNPELIASYERVKKAFDKLSGER